MRQRVRYIYIPLLLLAVLVPSGYYFVEWSKGGEGDGLYSRQWQPVEGFGYWHPDQFYQSVESISGEFEGRECVTCHESVTPVLSPTGVPVGIRNPPRVKGRSTAPASR
ncbi:hypothetical protein [Candidatus Reidiella endopervernicosa]|uniref:hypothetical protein n=1 Tax=Candidatus Reidiella endopervernicosa TaxID=2738883 RepID=UPI001F33D716|nr:hypothetical protein [Candidatus Reidiella endopervernicosa]